jgi:hypothetical protein
MKTAALRKACVWLRMLSFLAGPLASAENPTTPPAVKIEVTVPASWKLLRSDQFPELFAASLSDALSRQGLSVPAAALRSVEEPTKVPYLLKIAVTEWRMAEAGDIACTFTASLQTPDGERRLGEYAGTRWAPGVLYSNSTSRAYYPTQLDGVRTLARDLERSELLSKSQPSPFAGVSQ